MRIRRAGIEDVETVVELSAALFREDAGSRDASINLDWPELEGREYFGALVSDDDSVCLLAEVEGEVVGYLAGHLRMESAMRRVKSAELESMYVRRGARDLGVGSALIGVFLRHSGSQNVGRVSVTAYAQNERAINLYEKFGFRKTRVSLETDL